MMHLPSFVASLLFAQLAIEPPSLDLGEVRGGTVVVAKVTLVNRGEAAATLVDLVRSCGCVEPEWPKRTLAPGERQTLAIKIRTLGQRDGPRIWPLVLISKSNDSLQRQPFEVRATLRNDIVIEPPQVALYVTKNIEQEITLVDRRELPLRVLAWEMKTPGVRVERVETVAGKTRLRLSVDAAALPVGRQDHVLVLSTNDPAYDRLELPVTLTRVEPPRVRWTPETPEVVIAAGQPTASTLITLRAEEGRSIDAVDAAGDGVSCTWAQNDSGAAVRVRIDRARFRGVQTAIRVVSGGAELLVPIVVRAE